MERLEEAQQLWWLLSIPLLFILQFSQLLWKRRIRKRLGADFPFENLVPKYSTGRQVIKLSAAVIVIALLSVALANPQSGSKMETFKREGIDIVFALDVSNSMLAEDTRPNRLLRAKQLISNCIDNLGGDRVGLIAYAGEAYPILPVTSDLSAARLFLDGLGPDMVSRQGTAFDEVIELAVGMLNSTEKHSKVLVILSDGEDHEGGIGGWDPDESGIKIFTIGFGNSRGVPIPLKDAYGRTSGYKEDRNGQKVITKLNESFLRDLAGKWKGQYFMGRDTRVTAQQLSDAFVEMEKSTYESSLFTDYEDQFYWFCGMALLTLLVDSFILERKMKWQGK